MSKLIIGGDKIGIREVERIKIISAFCQIFKISLLIFWTHMLPLIKDKRKFVKYIVLVFYIQILILPKYSHNTEPEPLQYVLGLIDAFYFE